MLLQIGDIVKTKKPHPCGKNEWEIVRMGADWKLKCLDCGKVVMLSSEQAQKSIKSKVDKSNE